MRWKAKNRLYEKATWHRWFAWHPVEIVGENVWLETVWRKAHIFYGGFADCIVEFNYSVEEPK